MKQFSTFSEDETVSAGADFARRLKPGDVVACFGDLGSGKTRFIKGICKGLGVGERVMSPTFTILREYEGDKAKVYHWDFYRVSAESELRELGFEESLNGICLIEWADRVQNHLPHHRYDVHFAMGNEEHIRQILIDEIVEVAA